VQRRMIERQFQRMESVPRIFGPDTNFVASGGRVQFGLNAVARLTVGAKTRLRERIGSVRRKAI